MRGSGPVAVAEAVGEEVGPLAAPGEQRGRRRRAGAGAVPPVAARAVARRRQRREVGDREPPRPPRRLRVQRRVGVFQRGRGGQRVLLEGGGGGEGRRGVASVLFWVRGEFWSGKGGWGGGRRRKKRDKNRKRSEKKKKGRGIFIVFSLSLSLPHSQRTLAHIPASISIDALAKVK